MGDVAGGPTDVARAVTRAVVGGVVVGVARAVGGEVSEVRDIYAAVRGEGNVHFEDAVCVEHVGRKGFHGEHHPL